MRVREGVAVGVGLLLSGLVPAAAQDRYEYSQVHMGMRVRIVLYADGKDRARTAATRAFARIRMLEDIMSDYRPESEVRRLARSGGERFPVSADLFTVLRLALEIAAASGGAFDPAAGALTATWRRAREEGRLPGADSLARALARSGWQWLELDSLQQSTRLTRPGIVLDLGGIAKGYILDEALAALREAGTPRAMIEAGGDIVAGDAPPGSGGWEVRVPGAPAWFTARSGALANAALSTSGPGGQSLVVGGTRYSHVVDPRTGAAITGSRQVHVIAGKGIEADALATAIAVLDPAGAARLMMRFPGAISWINPVPD